MFNEDTVESKTFYISNGWLMKNETFYISNRPMSTIDQVFPISDMRVELPFGTINELSQYEMRIISSGGRTVYEFWLESQPLLTVSCGQSVAKGVEEVIM